jgi:hypothetical protein
VPSLLDLIEQSDREVFHRDLGPPVVAGEWLVTRGPVAPGPLALREDRA